MNKKAFTLIELLAVIVILAIIALIALIAVPMISKIIDKTEDSAALRGAELYIDGVNEAIMRANLNNKFRPKECIIQSNGNLICDGETELVIEATGTKPNAGTLEIEDRHVKSVDGMFLDGYEIESNEKGNLVIVGTMDVPKIIKVSQEVLRSGIKLTVNTTNTSEIVGYSFDDGATWQEENNIVVIENKEYKIKIKDTTGNVSEAYIVKVTDSVCRVTYETTTPNAPDLYSGKSLTPVKWNGSNWVVTTSTDIEWYNYENYEWANAVILKTSKSIGATINVESDVYAMFVWIPRYEYKIDGDYGQCGTSAKTPGAIDIKFVEKSKTTADSGYHMHPAFTFGSTQLSGIWFGKFETTGTTSAPTILPNSEAIVAQSISVDFATAQKFKTSYLSSNTALDTHMAKNSEWVAAAYLSQSKYGKYGNKGTQPSRNNHNITGEGFGVAKTGCGWDQDNYYSTTCNEYNTEIGQAASTTGNITGIYDMHGGNTENVMGRNNAQLDDSGFSSLPAAKYYDYYTSIDSSNNVDFSKACNGGPCYGHGLIETNGWYGSKGELSKYSGWTWFSRGSNNTDTYHGLFDYSSNTGGPDGTGYYFYYAFRTVLTAA